MHPVQIFVVLAAIAAFVAIGVPFGADDSVTGAIETVSAVTGEAWTCDQLLYLEELELLSGSACS